MFCTLHILTVKTVILKCLAISVDLDCLVVHAVKSKNGLL